MKFVMYKVKGDEVEHRLIMEEEGKQELTTYIFKGDMILSNYPNMTQIGGIVKDNFSSRKWLSYHEEIMSPNYELVDKGEYKLLETNDKFSQYSLDGELHNIDGNWIIRNGRDNRVLLWKPLRQNDKFSCACNSLSSNNKSVDKIYVDDKFSHFLEIGTEGEFSGIMIATGVYTGHANRPTLFTKDIIQMIYEKYKSNPEIINVDNDHDGIITGAVDRLRKLNNPTDRIVVDGHSNRPIAFHSGLSIESTNQLVWDDTFKVWVLVDIDIKTVSIINGEQPACDICYVNN